MQKAREGSLGAPAPVAANHLPAKVGDTAVPATAAAALRGQNSFPGVQSAVTAAPAVPAPSGPADQRRLAHAAHNAPQSQAAGAQQQQQTASAAEPDQARQASNAAAGPSGAAPKGAARLRVRPGAALINLSADRLAQTVQDVHLAYFNLGHQIKCAEHSETQSPQHG